MAVRSRATQAKSSKNPIPFFDSKRQYQALKPEIDNAIRAVIESGVFVDGVANRTFESELAKYCGSKYAVTVSNGTSALFLALIDAGISNGHEVLVPSHTFIATIEAIYSVGAKPVFCDISPYTYNIRMDEIERKKTKATKAILPVHMYGSMCNMDDISSYAKGHGLVVIEDACQAIGSKYHGRKAGSIGDYGCFSFYPTKNLGTYGEGGAILTNSLDSYENIKALRNHNAASKYFHNPGGFNFRMPELQAAVLVAKIRSLDSAIKKRRKLAKVYSENLSSTIAKPVEPKLNEDSYHLYVIRHDKRDALAAYLEKKGISTGMHYPVPCHTQYKLHEKLPFTDLISKQVLSLPLFPELEESEVLRVCEAVNGF